MRILFIGDYSNYHVTLAHSLRSMGHECTVVSSGSGCMNTERDINLQRTPGIVGGIVYAYRFSRLCNQLKGYDIVQIISPNFLHLRPWLNYRFFRQLKWQNGKMSLSVCGSDPVIIDAMSKGNLFRYSELRIGHKPTPYVLHNPHIEQEWLSDTMRKHCRRIYNEVDFAVSSLYEYQVASQPEMGQKLHYLGIPVNTTETGISPAGTHDKLNLFVGIKSELETLKGTDILLRAAQRVEREYPDLCRVTVARDLPYHEYISRLEDADVVLDQIYSYTPATNALQTMAMGKVAVSGAEPEYYDFINEHELHPIVNALPDEQDIYNKLKELVLNRTLVEKLASQGREFVQRHNEADMLARKFLEIAQTV